MAELVSQVSQIAGQPASVRIGTVTSINPVVISAQGTVFTDVGFIGSYRPSLGDPVLLLGQANASGSDPASWAAIGRLASAPASQVLMTKLQRNAAQSIPNNAFTAISWDAILFDNMNGFPAGSSTTVTAPFDGWYELTGRPTFQANITGIRQGVWFHNGSATESFVNMNATTALGSRFAMLTHFINATAGDQFQMQVFQNSGVAVNTEPGSGVFPQMTVRYLGTSVT